jgi:hypothetical protein
LVPVAKVASATPIHTVAVVRRTYEVSSHEEEGYAPSCQSLSLRSKRGFAVLKKLDGVHFRAGLVAAAIFALAYAVETKTILALEQSQNPFEVAADHEQGMYR